MVILLFLYGNFMAPTTRSNSGFVGIRRPRTSTGSRGQDLALIDGGWTTSCARCSFLGMVEKVHEGRFCVYQGQAVRAWELPIRRPGRASRSIAHTT